MLAPKALVRPYGRGVTAEERRCDDRGDGPEVALPKGDVTEGVVRVGDTVRRPHQPASPAVAAYLDHLRAAGFDGAPRCLGRDARGRDVLDFVAGAVAGAPLPDWAAAEELLAGVGRLLRRLHDASASWRPGPELRFAADLAGGPPHRLPGGPRLVSHNDATPQNVVARNGTAVALIDFDLAGWTTRSTDLATTAMYWVPLLDLVDRDPVLRDADVPGRLEVLVD